MGLLKALYPRDIERISLRAIHLARSDPITAPKAVVQYLDLTARYSGLAIIVREM